MYTPHKFQVGDIIISNNLFFYGLFIGVVEKLEGSNCITVNKYNNKSTGQFWHESHFDKVGPVIAYIFRNEDDGKS